MPERDETLLAGEWQDTDDTPGTDLTVVDEEKEPGTEVEVAEPESREALEASAELEADTAIILDELGDTSLTPELTLDDIKRLPQADGLTDDEILEIAYASGALARPSTSTPSGTNLPVKRAWSYIGPDGKEVADPSKLTVAEFLKGKFGYRALQATQQKSFDELVRLAQLGHFNEKQVVELSNDRAFLAQRVAELAPVVEKAMRMQQVWAAILSDRTGQAFLKAQGDYFNALQAQPAEPAQVSPEVIEARGQTFYNQRIYPALQKVAAAYGANITEIDTYARHLLAQIPQPLMTQERVAKVINEEIPMALEQAGYVYDASRDTSSSVTPVIPAKQDNAEMLRLRAENANLRKASTKAKLRRAPTGGRRSVDLNEGGSGEKNNLEAALEGKSSADARKILRNLR